MEGHIKGKKDREKKYIKCKKDIAKKGILMARRPERGRTYERREEIEKDILKAWREY